MCRKYIGPHKGADSCKDTYLCKNKERNRGSSSDHPFFLCLSGEYRRGGTRTRQSSRQQKELTEEQEKFHLELPPKQVEKCKRAFRAVAENGTNSKSGLLEENGLKELPVIMMLMEVTTNTG